MLSPVLHELAEEKSGTLKVGKVNVDEQKELAMRFQVSSIPMLVVFKMCIRDRSWPTACCPVRPSLWVMLRTSATTSRPARSLSKAGTVAYSVL